MGAFSQEIYILVSHFSPENVLFAPSDAHAIPIFIESKILPVNIVYFDKIANLKHDRLAPSPITGAPFTRSNEIH